MKPNIRALLDRCISDGVQHTFLNTDVEVSHTDEVRLIGDIENRIWCYIDEYFTFDFDQ